MTKNLLVFFVMILVTLSCKKPFSPALSQSDNKRYLVVEGFLTGGDSTIIKLSRTKIVDTSKNILAETNAMVTVEDDANNTTQLSEIKSGTYAAPPFNLDPGHKYRLRIKTADSKVYLSDFVPVKNAPEIDSVGFAASSSGVQIYVNAHDVSNTTRYYRWDYSETWQFHSQYRSTLTRDGARLPADQIYDCFGNDTSTSVTLATTIGLGNDILYQAPITAIDAHSEKIETKYSILVKQFALTSDAYVFWQNLQKNTQKIGSIFDVLPSEAPTNIRCVTDPAELVVGYLSAGNVTYKRIFITKGQLPLSYKTVYPSVCELDTAYTVNPPVTQSEKGQTDAYFQHTDLYMPVLGLYLPPANPFGGPTAISYSTVLCVDCTIRGATRPPPFWK